MRFLKLFFLWVYRILKYAWLTVWTLYQIALGAVLVGIVWLVIQLAAYFHIQDILALRAHPPKTTAFMETERRALRDSLQLARLGKARALPDTTIRWSWVPMSAIPQQMADMALVAEDSKFYSHEGFDLEQIEYAMVANHQAGRPMRGASTITQQVAKNLYLRSGKEMQRKVHEAALALLLEHFLSKDRILEVYLNIAQFGRGLFGVRAASLFYFHEEPAQLTQDQILSLVCLLPSPDRWSPFGANPGYLLHKRQVLRNYALFKGIQSVTDSTSPNWMHGVYDSLGNLLNEERWKQLRKGPLPSEQERDSGLAAPAASGAQDPGDEDAGDESSSEGP